MKKIILDTNFVTIPFDFKVDIYEEINRLIDEKYELVFSNVCLNELKKLDKGKPSLELMKKKNVNFVTTPEKRKVDDSIIEYAKENNAIIATQDAELKKKALKESLAIITLRKKQYLIISKGV